MTDHLQPTTPPPRAATEARDHRPSRDGGGERDDMNYTCPNECVATNHPGREHEQWTSDLIAERDRLRALVDALSEKTPEERLLEAIFGSAGCRCGCGAPRWDEDPIVLEHGWNTPDRCGRCGEVSDETKPETTDERTSA